MSTITFAIFSRWKGIKGIDEDIIENFLNLAESIIRITNKKRITKEYINKLEERLGHRFEGKIYPGGKDTLFAWSFPTGEGRRIIIKPYQKKDLTALILHHLTISEYGERIEHSLAGGEMVTVLFPPTIGIAKINTTSGISVPVLITFESSGELLDPQYMRIISKITRLLAKKGLIVDFSPSNWRIIPTTKQNYYQLEYIDLILSNTLTNTKEKIAALIDDITKGYR